MKALQNIVLIAIAVIAIPIASCKRGSTTSIEPKEITVLGINTWLGATAFPGAFQAMIDEIARLNPDIVTFSEIQNEDGKPFFKRVVESLAEKNKTYYSFYSIDTGLLSRYPIINSSKILPSSDVDGSTAYKLITKIANIEVAVYSAHLDYRYYAPYLPRGYDGYTWEKMPEPITDVDKILEHNLQSQRNKGVKALIQEAKADVSAGRLVIIGGDLNEPSHRDWIEENKNLYDRRGCVVPWTTTFALEEAGYIDSYREKYPNPLTHPGFTYPADCKQVPVSKIAWAPEADDRDRIDYIFYYPHPQIFLKDCAIVGPSSSIVHNQRVEETSQDVFVRPTQPWFTDHKGVLATFAFTED